MAIMVQLALSADGAFLGVGLGYVAVRCVQKYIYLSSALSRIRKSPEVHASEVRSLIELRERMENESNSGSADDMFIVRGTVEAVEKGNRKDSRSINLLISPDSGERGVILEQSQTCIYAEWRRSFGWRWASRLWSLLPNTSTEKVSLSIRSVPFALVEHGNPSLSDSVVVNLDGSTHQLPLKTVYQDFRPTASSPYAFLCALSGLKFPIGLLYEEKILPVGKDVTAVGICHLKDGIPEIKSCKDLPFFLCELRQNEMVSGISMEMNILKWSGIVLGTVAVGIVGYSISRHWNRWKEWRQVRRSSSSSSSSSEEEAVVAADDSVAGDDESSSSNIGDGELCVVCLTRRRAAAFTPCGHLVCCQRCASAVERENSPLCPVCRQSVRSWVRIYVS
ncbi:hypothetical protein M569_12398 [Genlisea aurea]|uniref:RING-type E3 ubiquitin transferase n=1 Tax=Genlisea aurea TaxID=192259 RepID=S8DRJ0_9LAMI|nr:hypothetical protein M569_12398 [Genlisea aurea]